MKNYKISATLPSGQTVSFFVYRVRNHENAVRIIRKQTSRALKRAGWVGKVKKTAPLKIDPVKLMSKPTDLETCIKLAVQA